MHELITVTFMPNAYKNFFSNIKFKFQNEETKNTHLPPIKTGSFRNSNFSSTHSRFGFFVLEIEAYPKMNLSKDYYYLPKFIGDFKKILGL